MTFNTLQFAAFALVVLAVYYSLQSAGRFRYQNWFLIAASYTFYSAWDWRFTAILAWITVVDFCCAIAIHRSQGWRRKMFLVISVASDLGLLSVFKYFGFFETSLVQLLGLAGYVPQWPLLRVVLPIGISFIVFESMSYTIDVYRRDLEPDYRFSSYMLFVSFFPKLVAGPIIRAKTLLHQIEHPRVIDRYGIERAAWWILVGYALKLVVADNLSASVDRVFATVTPSSGGEALLGIYAFALQIFGDFAGYSSIAIGVAGLLGFTLPRNFRQPYLVENPQEFWRHWHISLSTWLRDYLYISLGGSRVTPRKVYRNLMVTMTLGGLWHGASWPYVFWGIYHGVLLCVHRLVTRGRGLGRARTGLARFAAVAGMLQLTCLGWLLFRARSLEQVGAFLRAIATDLTLPGQPARELLVRVALAGMAVFGYQWLQARYGDDFPLDAMAVRARAATFASCYLAIVLVGEFGIKSFIYFQF